MAGARNDAELVKMLKPALKKAVEYILDQILKENEEYAIPKAVYDAYEPTAYHRTGEFAKAWSKQVHVGNHLENDVEGFMFYDWHKMSVGSDNSGSDNYAQHIGVAEPYQGVDSRAYLADIIYEGLSGSAFGHGKWNKKRNAYNILIRHIGIRRFNKWVKEGLQYAGFKLG